MPNSSKSPPPKCPPLVEGQLRFIRDFGIALRVLSVQGESATVERLPGPARLDVAVTRDLESLPRVAEDGFCMAWLQGDVTMSDEAVAAIADLIWKDEKERGEDRLRVRYLDDYLRLIGADPPQRQRMKDFLATGRGWVRVGRGSDLGYVPGAAEERWQDRWNLAEIPIPVGAERGEESDALKRLIATLPFHNPPVLGRIGTCAWVPRATREPAIAELAGRWRDPALRPGFRQVFDAALELMFPAFSDPELREAALDASLSLGARRAVLRLLSRSHGPVSFSVLLPGGPSIRPSRVAAHLLVLADNEQDRALALMELLKTPPPPADEEGKQVVHLVRQGIGGAASRAQALLLDSARRSLQQGLSIQSLMGWLEAVDDGTSGVPLRVLVEAIGTSAALRGESDPLTAFSPPAERVAEMLHGRLTREAPVGEEQSLDYIDAEVLDASWARANQVRASRAAHTSRVPPLLSLINRLLEVAQDQHRHRIEAERKADDPRHAASLLEREKATVTHEERQRLVASARDEVSRQREHERQALARLVGEVLTALGRAEQAGDLTRLPQVVRRVVELAAEQGLEPFDPLGSEVFFEPERHEARLRPGDPGKVVAPGIKDRDGRILLRARLIPTPGADR